jgi:hypothetical protein
VEEHSNVRPYGSLAMARMALMITEMRTYSVAPGRLDDWIALFHTKVRPFREKNGFNITGAWAVPAESEFVWVVSFDGTEAEFREADAAYYELPDHEPLHNEALSYLTGSRSFIVEPVDR